MRGGRHRWEQVTSQSPASPFRAGNLVMHFGRGVLGSVLVLRWFALDFFKFSFPLVVFSFLAPIQFVPPLFSGLDSEIVVLTGRYDQNKGQDEDVHCHKGRRWISHLFRMAFGASGVGQFSDSSSELCELAHLPARDP